jgi:hypothetical protein
LRPKKLLSITMLATRAPEKNATSIVSAVAAAPNWAPARSLESRPTLPVTWDVKVPITTKPAESTKPPTRAR